MGLLNNNDCNMHCKNHSQQLNPGDNCDIVENIQLLNNDDNNIKEYDEIKKENQDLYNENVTVKETIKKEESEYNLSDNNVLNKIEELRNEIIDMRETFSIVLKKLLEDK